MARRVTCLFGFGMAEGTWQDGELGGGGGYCNERSSLKAGEVSNGKSRSSAAAIQDFSPQGLLTQASFTQDANYLANASHTENALSLTSQTDTRTMGDTRTLGNSTLFADDEGSAFATIEFEDWYLGVWVFDVWNFAADTFGHWIIARAAITLARRPNPMPPNHAKPTTQPTPSNTPFNRSSFYGEFESGRRSGRGRFLRWRGAASRVTGLTGNTTRMAWLNSQ